MTDVVSEALNDCGFSTSYCVVDEIVATTEGTSLV
jgi:hypothetical protein